MPPGEFRFHSVFGVFSFCKDVSKPSIFYEIICISKRTVVILISVLYYTAFFKVKNWIVLFSLSFVWFISGERISLGVIFPGGIFTRGNFLGGKFLGGNFHRGSFHRSVFSYGAIYWGAIFCVVIFWGAIFWGAIFLIPYILWLVSILRRHSIQII